MYFIEYHLKNGEILKREVNSWKYLHKLKNYFLDGSKLGTEFETKGERQFNDDSNVITFNWDIVYLPYSSVSYIILKGECQQDFHLEIKQSTLKGENEQE